MDNISLGCGIVILQKVSCGMYDRRWVLSGIHATTLLAFLDEVPIKHPPGPELFIPALLIILWL